MATSAPSSARASAMARPIPREPPVTSAVRPLSFMEDLLRRNTPSVARTGRFARPPEPVRCKSRGLRYPLRHRVHAESGGARLAPPITNDLVVLDAEC